jgi:hypothetical protein
MLFGGITMELINFDIMDPDYDQYGKIRKKPLEFIFWRLDFFFSPNTRYLHCGIDGDFVIPHRKDKSCCYEWPSPFDFTQPEYTAGPHCNGLPIPDTELVY